MTSQGWKSDPKIAQEVLERAKTVRFAGQWLGLFEWIAWGVMHQARVLMMFGSNIVDVIAELAPQVSPVTWKKTHRVIAVHLRDGIMLSSVPESDSHHPQVNHYTAARLMDDASQTMAKQCLPGQMIYLHPATARTQLQQRAVLDGISWRPIAQVIAGWTQWRTIS